LALLDSVKQSVDARLATAFDDELAGAGRLGPEVLATLTAAKDLSLRGGKRLRAGLVVLGFVAASGQRVDKNDKRSARWARSQSGDVRYAAQSDWRMLLECGVAVELLQSYFLVHDDWMDQDAERRGGPSVHAALERAFEQLAAEVQHAVPLATAIPHRAACGAVLAGDYLVALANQRLLLAARKHKRLAGALDVFQRMQLDAVLGQQLDVIGLCRDAELIYRLKTSSYTVSGPLELGAVLASASEKQLKKLRAFANPVGVAFQIRDDLLSLFGDPAKTGKPFASDLRSGKWTWVVQQALTNGTEAEKNALRRCFGEASATTSQLKKGVAALESSGARAATEAKIAELTLEAVAALTRMKLGKAEEALFRSAITALVDRGM
jgi:geranylgeranyl diphosphate synthase type I